MASTQNQYFAQNPRLDASASFGSSTSPPAHPERRSIEMKAKTRTQDPIEVGDPAGGFHNNRWFSWHIPNCVSILTTWDTMETRITPRLDQVFQSHYSFMPPITAPLQQPHLAWYNLNKDAFDSFPYKIFLWALTMRIIIFVNEIFIVSWGWSETSTSKTWHAHISSCFWNI